jgi:hypothetical protein
MTLWEKAGDESRRGRRNRFREWDQDRVRTEAPTRFLLLAFILCVLALGMMHLGSQM